MNTQTVTHVPARPPPQHPVRTRRRGRRGRAWLGCRGERPGSLHTTMGPTEAASWVMARGSELLPQGISREHILLNGDSPNEMLGDDPLHDVHRH